MTKKKEHDARRHAERMTTDLNYRMRKVLNSINARCFSGKGRKDWQWYGAKGLEVTLTVADLVALWHRDFAVTMTKPDIDRKENSLGYTYDNCRFIEHSENLRRMIATRKPRRWHKRPAEEKGTEI